MEARIVVNCAGVDSARLHNQLCPEKPLTIIPHFCFGFVDERAKEYVAYSVENF